MSNGFFSIPEPRNEPVRNYEPGSPERERLKKKLETLAAEQIEIPIIIGGQEIRSGNTSPCVMPHDHGHQLGFYHQGDATHIEMAAKACREAWAEWSEMPWEERAAIFLKAAELLCGPYRDLINSAAMLNTSKTVYQAEIDAACELADFLRFNAHFMTEIYRDQPISSPGTWNRCEYRALEGFVLAVTPFNFQSIAGNLPSSPAMMGNTVIWKPASSTVYPAYFIMKLFEEAGLPPGVINMLPAPGSAIGKHLLAHPDFAGVHFTGSTGVFQRMWRTVGENIARYRSYPRIVGETGGKDFIVAHASADVDALMAAVLRGAFEYQGQKCSAASRLYVPKSMWKTLKPRVKEEVEAIKMGDVRDFTHFMGAVIDAKAFESITSYIDYAKTHDGGEILIGGEYDASRGYFIRPTVIEATDPGFKTMREEIFGPVLTVFAYDDDKFEDTLALCDSTSEYALTGAIFAQDRRAVTLASRALRHAAGNFYINDKPTGAVVGQQPFGGGRASGTNDKAGSKINLMKWLSTRTIKENFNPPKHYGYPFMMEP